MKLQSFRAFRTTMRRAAAVAPPVTRVRTRLDFPPPDRRVTSQIVFLSLGYYSRGNARLQLLESAVTAKPAQAPSGSADTSLAWRSFSMLS